MVLQQYQDQRVAKYLRYGYWYAAHRGTILRALRLVLVLLTGLIWLSLFWRVYVYVQAARADKGALAQLATSVVPGADLHERRAPVVPIISEAYVLSGRDSQSADFVALAENPNENWAVTLEYVFSWAGGETLPETLLLLPKSKLPLARRGITVQSVPALAEITVRVERWQRLRSREILARLTLFREQLTVAPEAVTQEKGVTVAAWQVENHTIYDLRDLNFAVVLYQFETPVAVGWNEVPLVSSGSSVTVEQLWPQDLPANLRAVVWPQFNVFGERSWELPGGGDIKF